MKCPKCEYLGFETGDRCKLCGYDFSLASPVASVPGDAFRGPEGAAALGMFDEDALHWEQAPQPRRGLAPTPDGWLHDVDRAVHQAPTPGLPPAPLEPEPVAAAPAPGLNLAPGTDAASRPEPEAPLQPPAAFRGLQGDRRLHGQDPASLPLFLSNAADDTPLVTVPARPRQPLAVRRTPDTPRLRVVPHAEVMEPALDFHEEPAPPRRGAAPVPRPGGPVTELVAGRRAAAAAIDLGVLLGIDVVVLYFTLRMTGLGGGELLTLPLAPLGAFLAMLAVGYFAAFTAIGGQTIGKMAVGVHVVSGTFGPVPADVALRRTLMSVIDVVTLGLAYLPALVGTDRRAVHDRLAGTRVIARQQA